MTTLRGILDFADPLHPTEYWRKKRAREQLRNLILTALPEKHVCSDECNISSNEWKIGHKAYKDAESNVIEDTRKRLKQVMGGN